MFYERYLALCIAKNIKPSTAATQAGFNRGTVSVWKKKYEAGQDVSPAQDVIDKICVFFGCTEQWLRGISAEDEKGKTPIQEDERKKELVDSAFFRVMQDAQSKGLSPEDLQMAIDFFDRARRRDQE